jgi:ABC-2 type transport system ATP-binding protein
MIEIRDLVKQFGAITAVSGISLSIEPGFVNGLLGPNGAGKSTTVKCIVGAIKPTSGAISVNGVHVDESPVEAKRMIGYVPENPPLFRNLTGKEYLTLVGKLYQVPDDELEERSSDLLARFGLADRQDEQLLSYSRGMAQKIVIASALVHNPQVLILDEPLAGLDAASAALLKEVVKSFAARGKTVLFLSHTLDVVEKLCDKIFVLCGGKLLVSGSAREILENTGSASLEEAFIRLTGVTNVAREAEEIVRSLG